MIRYLTINPFLLAINYTTDILHINSGSLLFGKPAPFSAFNIISRKFWANFPLAVLRFQPFELSDVGCDEWGGLASAKNRNIAFEFGFMGSSCDVRLLCKFGGIELNSIKRAKKLNWIQKHKKSLVKLILIYKINKKNLWWQIYDTKKNVSQIYDFFQLYKVQKLINDSMGTNIFK